MRIIKSERLKKLETELNDLTQWLKLGLVPKKDVKKHEEEIKAVEAKIQEELDRLQFLRENGEADDGQQTPKRGPTRTAYTDMPTIPDLDVPDTAMGYTETGLDNDQESSIGHTGSSSRIKDDDDDEATSSDDDDEYTESDADEESYFSEKNRWKRGGIIDPDADEW